MKTMFFCNQMFPIKGSLTCTVRMGEKDSWWNRSVEIGERLKLTGSIKGLERVGVVEKILRCRFMDLKYIDIQNLHDPKCRDKDHLSAVMRDTSYEGFNESSIIMVIYIRME